MAKWALAIHGGAGVISRSTHPTPYIVALNDALSRGQAVLRGDCNALPWARDGIPQPPLALAAAQAAVEAMEDCELFNAGKIHLRCVFSPK